MYTIKLGDAHPVATNLNVSLVCGSATRETSAKSRWVITFCRDLRTG